MPQNNPPDRLHAPGIAAPVDFHFPDAEKHVTLEGIPVFVIHSGTQDVVKIEFVFSAGNLSSEIPLLASAANELLDEGTANYSSAELAEALDYYGAYFQTESTPDYAGITLYSLNKFVDQTLPYVADLLLHPAYPAKEIETYSIQGKQRLAVQLNKVDVLARRAFFSTLFGEQHPYGRVLQPEHYDTITTENLKEFHIKRYKGGLKAVFVSGLPGKNTVQRILRFIDEAGFHPSELPDFSSSFPGPQRVFVPKPDAMQSAIRIGRRLFRRKHPDYFTFSVLNTILGGYFGSRLMSNIREDKGYTYGIGSGVVSQHLEGYFFIATEVGADVREAAVREIYHELKRLREEAVSEEELTLVKNYMTGAIQRSLDGPFALAEKQKMLYLNNLDSSYLNKQLSAIQAVTAGQIKYCAEKYLQERDFTEVIAGK